MSKKTSVPKRIAGVKLGKELRRALRKLGGSKAGRALVATGLAALAAAIAEGAAAPKTPRRRAKPAPGRASAPRRGANGPVEPVVDAETDPLAAVP